MTNDATSDGNGQTRTTIEVDRDVWREVRSAAVADGVNVSEKLEEVLADYFEVSADD